jgi:hypothetical protein
VFAAASDLLPGQELIANVESDLVAGSAPTFSTSSLYLEPSQLIGVVGAVNTAGASLELDGLTGSFLASQQGIQRIEVQTGATTSFVGFSSPSVAAVNAGQFVAAKGPLFNTIAGLGYPTLSAIDVRVRESAN